MLIGLRLHRPVITIGVNNLIVGDIKTLPVSDTHSEQVKDVVQDLKDSTLKKKNIAISPPWGAYDVLEEGPNFKVKRIMVKRGKSSLQMHEHRANIGLWQDRPPPKMTRYLIFIKTNQRTYHWKQSIT